MSNNFFVSYYKYENMKKIIFCQAVGDISHVQNIIDSDSGSNFLVILTLESVIEIVRSNNLFGTAEIISLPYPYTIKQHVLFRFKLNQIKSRLLNLNIKEAYIFSLAFDWISLSLLHYLSKTNLVIFYIDLYHNIKDVGKRYSLPAISRSIYYFLLTGVKFNYFFEIDNRLVVVYKNKKKVIVKGNKKDYIVNNQPKFLYTSIDYTNSIVFIDSMSATIKRSSGASLLQEILNHFKQLQLPIYIKKHPNFNFTFNFLDQYPQADNIPIELIDLSKCKCIVGIGSSAIINNNAPLRISLLNMYFKPELEEEIKRFKFHLTQLDKQFDIEYPNSIDELLMLLKRISC